MSTATETVRDERLSRLPLPPSPGWLGTMVAMWKRREMPVHRRFDAVARDVAERGVARLEIGMRSIVVICDAELTAEALAKPGFSGRAMQEILDYYGDDLGLQYRQYGGEWERRHEFATGQFWTRDATARMATEHFAPMLDGLVGRLEQAAESDGGVDLHPEFHRFSYDAFFRSLFGHWESETAEFARNREEFRRLLFWLLDALVYNNAADAFPFLKRIPRRFQREARSQMARRRTVLNALFDEVREYREGGAAGVPGMVDALLAGEDSGASDRATNFGFCIATLGAGAHGVAAATAWLLLVLANRPAMQARVHAEMDSVLGADGARAGLAEWGRLPYLMACLGEVMRYRTVVPFIVPRMTSRDMELGGYRIPAGSEVWGSTISAHNDARHWESPSEFVPERFLPSDGGEDAPAWRSVAYTPFGTGTRACTGGHVAMVGAWVTAVRLLQEFRFEAPDGGAVSEDEVFAVSVQPADSRLRVLRR